MLGGKACTRESIVGQMRLQRVEVCKLFEKWYKAEAEAALRQLQAQPDNLARGTASCRAGQQPRHVRVMSWNAGHLGQQQWGELKTWLAAEAEQYSDVLILQETHWTATTEFAVSGWSCADAGERQRDSGSWEQTAAYARFYLCCQLRTMGSYVRPTYVEICPGRSVSASASAVFRT
eukprot:s6221_g6.t1